MCNAPGVLDRHLCKAQVHKMVKRHHLRLRRRRQELRPEPPLHLVMPRSVLAARTRRRQLARRRRKQKVTPLQGVLLCCAARLSWRLS